MSTNPRSVGPPTETRDAWTAYRALHLLVDPEIARDLERHSGLSMADFEVLAAAVALADDEPCVRVSGLAARMNWSHSRLSRQLGRMERRGLISREPCERDGRGDDVLVADPGRRAYEEAASPFWDSVHRNFTARLTPSQRVALTEISEALGSGGT